MEPKEENEKPNQRKFLTWITIFFAFTLLLIAGLSYYLVFLYPENQVSQLGITNITGKANFINQYRITSIQLISTFAQIFGGIAVLIGIYFAWGNLRIAQSTLESNQKNAEKNLEIALANLKSDQEAAQKNIEISLATLDSNIKNAQKSLEIAQEGQITERFTRAIEQLGSNKMEIRLGGIYSLERIANESERDCWPIIEILTAYVRKNSPCKKTNMGTDEECKESENLEYIPLDIQAVLTVIKKCTSNFNLENSTRLDLESTYLRGANLERINLKRAILDGANLDEVTFEKAILEEANLESTFLRFAILKGANLKGADFYLACLFSATLKGANLEGTNFIEAKLMAVDLEEANLKGAYLEKANLKGAMNLTIGQLSKVKTLYKAELDEELLVPLKEMYPALFEEPEE